MVYSNVEPDEILITPTEQRLCWGIIQEEFEDEIDGGTYLMYVYHEIIFKDKTKDFLEQNKEQIIENPENYNYVMLDGNFRNR